MTQVTWWIPFYGTVFASCSVLYTRQSCAGSTRVDDIKPLWNKANKHFAYSWLPPWQNFWLQRNLRRHKPGASNDISRRAFGWPGGEFWVNSVFTQAELTPSKTELNVEYPRTNVFQHLYISSATHPQKISIIGRCSHADRIPVLVRFSAPVHTGPGAHPASCTADTESFLGVKW